MGKTSIEWTDFSVNPIRARLGDRVGHYCEKVSPGCKHCYSSRLQPRFGLPVFQDQRTAAVEPFLDVSKLVEVLKRRKPTRWFWCDMTDMFGEWVPFEWIAACFGVMAATPHHTHQVLTKRPERALEFFRLLWVGEKAVQLHALGIIGERFPLHPIKGTLKERPWPLPNVWLGTSVEDQRRADERIPALIQCPASVRFLSVEPMLEAVDLTSVEWPGLGGHRVDVLRQGYWCPGGHAIHGRSAELGAPKGGFVNHSDMPGRVSWVIVGGESGHGARPCDVGWVRSLVRQCSAADVPIFVKQLGANYVDAPNGVGGWRARPPKDLGIKIRNLNSPKGGDPEEWPADLRVRQFPKVRHA